MHYESQPGAKCRRTWPGIHRRIGRRSIKGDLWKMQRISLISTLTLLALVSVGSVVTLAVNPFSTGGHASAPQLNIPQMNSVNSTSSGDPSSSSTSTHTSTSTSTSTSTTNSSGLLTNSTGLLTSPPPSHSGDDGSGDDGSSSCGVTTQTSLTTTVTTTTSCTRYDD